jgi:hypothetical protein
MRYLKVVRTRPLCVCALRSEACLLRVFTFCVLCGTVRGDGLGGFWFVNNSPFACLLSSRHGIRTALLTVLLTMLFELSFLRRRILISRLDGGFILRF